MTRTITWRYPQFSRTDASTTPALDRVNGEILSSMQRKWQENQRPLNSGAHLSGDIDVASCKDGIVSIRDAFDNGAGVLFASASEYRQGWRIYGQTSGVVSCPIYDLTSGAQVDPWTYVGMTRSELLDATRRAIRTYYANRGRFGSVTIDDMLEGFDEHTGDAARNYYLSDKGLVYKGHMYEFFSRSVTVHAPASGSRSLDAIHRRRKTVSTVHGPIGPSPEGKRFPARVRRRPPRDGGWEPPAGPRAVTGRGGRGGPAASRQRAGAPPRRATPNSVMGSGVLRRFPWKAPNKAAP